MLQTEQDRRQEEEEKVLVLINTRDNEGLKGNKKLNNF